MRNLNFLSFTFILFLIPSLSFSQNIKVEGYVYEEGNRGFLNVVEIKVIDLKSKALKAETSSNLEGFFEFELPAGSEYRISAAKKVFHTKMDTFSTVGIKPGVKKYLKVQMERQPGYLFDATLAPVRSDEDIVVDAITDARIEIYNNTTEKEELVYDKHPVHTFSYTLQQGNHYTIMIRKKGFFTKRIEANVNVNGCILCFEGLGGGGVKPGVADNLTKRNSMGTLVANIELRPVELNKPIEVKNIYYDLGKYEISDASAKELDFIVGIMKANPSFIIQLGSHTDSRGDDESNRQLSLKRAKAAVDYILSKGDIQAFRIKAIGFGESNLVNDCKNDVDCSEREHSVNRRTEFRVTSVLAKDPFQNLSLAQIIERENFKGGMSEEVVFGGSEFKAGEKGDVPDDLKAYIESQKKKKSNSGEVVIASSEKVVEKSKVESKKKPKARVEAVKKEPVAVLEKTSTKEIQRPKIITSNAKIIKQENLKVPSFVADLQQIDGSTTGFFILIKSSAMALNEEDPLFHDHGKLFVNQTQNGFEYFIGSFESEINAKGFYKVFLSDKYPGASVKQFAINP